jgi:hypothetical protein
MCGELSRAGTLVELRNFYKIRCEIPPTGGALKHDLAL